MLNDIQILVPDFHAADHNKYNLFVLLMLVILFFPAFVFIDGICQSNLKAYCDIIQEVMQFIINNL